MVQTVVVALGGNAILQSGQRGTYQEQLTNVRASANSIADLVEANYRVVITHGNGPQVGNIMLQNEEAKHLTPPMPLFACGAQTQGLIGFMLQTALDASLSTRGLRHKCISLVTPVLVDCEDPSFKQPSKPIGPFYTEALAHKLMKEQAFKMVEDAGRGWRRVVPSPEPRRIIGIKAIQVLLDSGYIPVTAGGGGIPVYESEKKGLVGVEAVVDKDLAAACLATQLDADILLILTDVPNVALNYGQRNQVNLKSLTVQEAREYQRQGHFQAGSMGPKVEAACRFVESRPGKRAAITSLDRALEALEKTGGTQFTRQ